MKKKTKRVEPRTVRYEVYGWGKSSYRPNLRGGPWSRWSFDSLDEAMQEVRRQLKDQEHHSKLDRLEGLTGRGRRKFPVFRAVKVDLLGVDDFDLVEHLERQLKWSRSTFGPGSAKRRWRGIVDHIAKELEEIARKPMDVEEWIDVAILAFDGALRAAGSADAVVAALSAKQRKNLYYDFGANEWRRLAPHREPPLFDPSNAPFLIDDWLAAHDRPQSIAAVLAVAEELQP